MPKKVSPSNVFKRCKCGGRGLCMDSRSVMEKGDEPYIRRRYKCEKCVRRFTTVEHRVELDWGKAWKNGHGPLANPPKLRLAMRLISECLADEVPSA